MVVKNHLHSSSDKSLVGLNTVLTILCFASRKRRHRGCPCDCCLVDTSLVIIITVILIFTFFFELHTYLIELAFNYWQS